jgi:hypothetical protein
MRERIWTVELRAQPTSDGLERLGQAVKLMVNCAESRCREEQVSNEPQRVRRGLKSEDTY